MSVEVQTNEFGISTRYSILKSEKITFLPGQLDEITDTQTNWMHKDNKFRKIKFDHDSPSMVNRRYQVGFLRKAGSRRNAGHVR